MKKRYEKALTPAELAALPDSEIDYSDIAETGEEFWKTASVRWPDERGKTPVSLRLDAEVLDWFRAQGKGYQTRINAVLRSFYEAHRRP